MSSPSLGTKRLNLRYLKANPTDPDREQISSVKPLSRFQQSSVSNEPSECERIEFNFTYRLSVDVHLKVNHG